MPAMITFSVVGTLLQSVINETRVVRLKYVLGSLNSQPEPTTAPEKTWSTWIIGVLGFTRVSEEERLRRLRMTRDLYLERIRELEVEELATKDEEKVQ